LGRRVDSTFVRVGPTERQSTLSLSLCDCWNSSLHGTLKRGDGDISAYHYPLLGERCVLQAGVSPVRAGVDVGRFVVSPRVCISPTAL
jgi:hypothetical protein